MSDTFLSLINNEVKSVTPIEAADGTQGRIPATNAAGALDASFLPAFPAATFPIEETLTAGVAVSGPSLINVYTNPGTGTIGVQPADAVTGLGADGFVLSGAGLNAPVVATLGLGIITGLSGLTPGAAYYLGNSGAISATPAATGYLYQYVGKALSATSLLFQPQSGIQQ